MKDARQGCKIILYQTDSYFIKIPSDWIEQFTLKKNNVLITKLTVHQSSYFLSVGEASQKLDCVEVGAVLEIQPGVGYIQKPDEHDIGLAELVSVAPVSQADWDIIKYNQSGIEHAVLTKIRSLQPNSTISIFLNSLKLRLKVNEIIPHKSCSVLQEMTEIEIIPMEDDDEVEFLSSDEELESDIGGKSAGQSSHNHSPFFGLISNLFNWKSQKEEELEEMQKKFNTTSFKEIFTISSDDSIKISSVCKVSAEHKSDNSPLFVKLTYRRKKTDKDKNSSVYCDIYLKCLFEENIPRNKIHLSKSLISWKELNKNERVLLECITMDASCKIISDVELHTDSKENAHEVQTLLESDFNIVENHCPFMINDKQIVIKYKSDAKYVFTSPSTKFTILENYEYIPKKSTPSKLEVPDIVLYPEEFDQCLNFCISSLDLFNGLGHRKSYHCLITGLPGVGKSTFYQQIFAKLSDEHNVRSADLDCALLKGKRADIIKKKIGELIADLELYKPSILVLNNIEIIFGVKDEEQSDDQSTNLAMWLTKLMKHITDSQRGLMIIGVAESLEYLNAQLTSQAGYHIFELVLKLGPPNKEAKEKLIESLLGRVPEEWKHDVLEEFLPCDVKLVCERMIASDGYNSALEIVKAHSPITHWGKALKQRSKKDINSVGGLLDAKDILTKTIVWQIKYPKIFESVGVRMPRGVLLYGAPGTGKTLLAESLASSYDMNILPVKGPELLSKYIGASERNVRDLFIKAQSAKPCVIFFDEFDSLAPKRGHDSTGVTDRVVNQLLTQLDGVEGLEGVWIIATTSRPDLIDGALLRPGRIDKSVLCPMPSIHDRLDILGKLSVEYYISDQVNLHTIAEMTEAFTGADLKAVFYSAKQVAKKKCSNVKEPMINEDDLIEAVQDIVPSVSTSELNRLNYIYSKFKSGKQITEVSQRATLA